MNETDSERYRERERERDWNTERMKISESSSLRDMKVKVFSRNGKIERTN